ncbi:hypothetical protein ACJMK2_001028 [Sinanodonta woodiana]|uniref:Uncharacterized protein n=1 Tax=Sinanodonta woodiana TaxID=1069815 RepID=A0ABD3XR14_SINWO
MTLSFITGHGPLTDAATLIVLLKVVRINKTDAKPVFTTEVDSWSPFHAFVLLRERKMLKIALKADVGVNFPMGKPEGLPGNCLPLHLSSVILRLTKTNTLAVKMLVCADTDLRQRGREYKHMASSDDTIANLSTCFLACSGKRRERKFRCKFISSALVIQVSLPKED